MKAIPYFIEGEYFVDTNSIISTGIMMRESPGQMVVQWPGSE